MSGTRRSTGRAFDANHPNLPTPKATLPADFMQATFVRDNNVNDTTDLVDVYATAFTLVGFVPRAGGYIARAEWPIVLATPLIGGKDLDFAVLDVAEAREITQIELARAVTHHH